MKFDLQGKVALITGAGAGIGRATAEAFLELGAKVAAVDIAPEKLDTLKQASGDGRLLTVVADVCEQADVDRMAAEVEARFGRLDVLMNNVGHHLAIIRRIEDTSREDWEALYRINLLHMFLVTKAVLPLMRRSGAGGSIINVSSVEAMRGCPSNVAYTTFKHAVTGFTRSMAIELSEDRIRVNAIAPESTDSEQLPIERMMKPGLLEAAHRSIPLGRLGRPEDSAGAAVFLASELSSWVTGTTLMVDGGSLTAGGFHRAPDGWSIHPVVSESAHPAFGARNSSEQTASAIR
jgi:NAD(P)-dependent dehydrogenase (short-subunit alcohol dehydrogenase family)